MIVITGAGGRVGNVLVRELLSGDKNKNVRAVIAPFESTIALDGLNVEKVTADVFDFDSLIKAFEGADVVYHLAGIVSIMPKDQRAHRINVIGTQNVVKACLKTGIKRLVYTSSVHAIKEPPDGVTIDESFPFDPDAKIGEYSRSKGKASLEILKGVEQGLDAVILCPTGIVGPFDYQPSEMGQLVIDFVKRKIPSYIDGAYDFVDVRDVVIGHILACEKGKKGEHYILSGERITIPDLMFLLEELTGVKAPRVKVPVWLAEVASIFTPFYYKLTNAKPRFTKFSIQTLKSNSLISNEKARRELNYFPRTLKESFQDAIEWFKKIGKV